MKIYIVTEGGAHIGLGHIARCTSLYQAFEEKKISPCFIVNGDNNLIPILNDKNYYLLDWIKNPEKLFEKIKGSDIVIIDSYLINHSLSQRITQIVKLTVFIDDTIRIDYPKGIVINSAIHAKDLNYSHNPNVKYLLGAEYSMLKKEFWDFPDKIINDEIKIIMLTFGGNDITNLTPKILKILQNEFPSIKKKIIIGKNFENIKDIEKLKDNKCELIYFPNAQGMKDVMLESDVAITAGGQTVYELASMCVPAITIAVVDHQIPHIKACAELGLNYYSGWWQNSETFNNIKTFLNKLKNVEVRKKMINLCSKYVKADGSREIIDFLMKVLDDKQTL